MNRCLPLALVLLVSATVAPAMAAGDEITLTIENHSFSPKEVRVPAGKKIKLLVVNKDATPAEFESATLNREKIIPGKAQTVIRMGPLKPGSYPFVEEFHEAEPGAQGTLIAE